MSDKIGSLDTKGDQIFMVQSALPLASMELCCCHEMDRSTISTRSPGVPGDLQSARPGVKTTSHPGSVQTAL